MRALRPGTRRVTLAIALASIATLGCRDLEAPAGTSRQAASACTAAPNLQYYGGPVIQNVRIYDVAWGANVSAEITGTMPKFYQAVVASPYLDWLSEYNTVGKAGVMDGKPGTNQGIARGRFAASVTITPAACAGTDACTLTDAQIQGELAAQIAAGTLPAPTLGCDGQNDTLYMLTFAPAVAIQQRSNVTTCAQICYYHGTGSAGGKSYAYAVLPDMSAPGCKTTCGPAAQPIDNQTAVASRALVEAVTDPELGLATSFDRPLGWYDTGCGEIGAICDQRQATITVRGTSFTVQQQWSNAAGDCIVGKSTLPPICAAGQAAAGDGGAGAGADGGLGCRPCACADEGQTAPGPVACTGAAPHCEAEAANVKHGTCVACTEGTQCGSGVCTKSAELATDDTCGAGMDGGGADGAPGDGGGGTGGAGGASGGSDAGGAGGGSSGCHCAAAPGGPAAPTLLLATAGALAGRRRRRHGRRHSMRT